MDKTREAFEHWYRTHHCWAPEVNPLGRFEGSGNYMDANVNRKWDGFQAGYGIGRAVGMSHEPASAMQDDSPRMMAIGQNGNNGEHYE